MRAFVTGGTGFIGNVLIRKLLERGYEVRALARSSHSASELHRMGVTFVQGDLDDREALREGMAGCDLVFHVAGWYRIGDNQPEQCEHINVTGTRNVLELAYELGIPKIVYTSTVAIFGDTHGQIVDEDYRMPAGQEFITDYDRTKWKAHYEVALPLIERGAPIIIVQPGVVIGPGDHSLIGDLMKFYARGWMLALPGPEFTVTYAHVEDIAEGHILAAEKGWPGESYIIAGPALSLGEIVPIWAKVTGRRPPFFSIPARFLAPFAPVVDTLAKYIPIPPLFSRDAVAMLKATYMARADKARRELGWEPRPLEEALKSTFEAIGEAETPTGREVERKRQIIGIALVSALILAVYWLIYRRRK